MAKDPDIVRVAQDGERVELHCPVSLPAAGAFLWNPAMLLQVNCRGYATAQHLQPEPAKYSHAPVLEQTTFMQPEPPYYAHHPGRFVYVKDEENGSLFSAPHAPVMRRPERFVFSAGAADLQWTVDCDGIRLRMQVTLPTDEVAELWTVSVANTGGKHRQLSIYPCFTVGYMSWMYQGAYFDATLCGIVARSVTPYQKLEDYPRIKTLKDRTCLLADRVPDAWETAQAAFEGDGGLRAPDGVTGPRLGCGEAAYETPAAVLQYRMGLAPGAETQYRFLFAPVHDDGEARRLRAALLAPGAAERTIQAQQARLRRNAGCLEIRTPDAEFDLFVNRFLGRQVFYHGDAHRMTTDPQTRNFLQDAMGMAYVDPARARTALLTTLAQQNDDGSLPEGIVLAQGTELKYINQVPHTDHCVWLPVCIDALLGETQDYGLLDQRVQEGQDRTVFAAVTDALRWLVRNRDSRHLSYIAQGDWCDPMNMVGARGVGVSGWLSIATVHALRLWARVGDEIGATGVAAEFTRVADETAAAVQQWLWDGDWFARGITDAGRPFGVAADDEGAIYLNPQSWAILAGIATPEQVQRMLAAIDARLDTPFGTALLAPAYTRMHEDIGRLTQKFPGTAENGSVYNHAAAFYIAALYTLGESDRAWSQLRRALPGPGRDDLERRGQLPAFVPNYYRGAWRQYPGQAGRSSQLCHTGAASWLYRLCVEQLFGLAGCREGLRVTPRLPSHWQEAVATRRFRGATFDVHYSRDSAARHPIVRVEQRVMPDGIIRHFEAGRHYRIDVALPTGRTVSTDTAAGRDGAAGVPSARA